MWCLVWGWFRVDNGRGVVEGWRSGGRGVVGGKGMGVVAMASTVEARSGGREGQ